MKYKILKEVEGHEVGEVIDTDLIPVEPEVLAKLTDEGFLEAVVEPAEEKKEPIEDSVGEDTGIVSKTYNGLEVISESIRIVSDREFHVIRLSDGSTYDLTEDDYQKAFNK